MKGKDAALAGDRTAVIHLYTTQSDDSGITPHLGAYFNYKQQDIVS
jgi:hypothetical protein